jgi:hypothetical protein
MAQNPQSPPGTGFENTDFNALTGKLTVKRIPGMETLYNGKQPDYMAATYMLNFKNVDWGKLHQAVLNDYPLTNVAKNTVPTPMSTGISPPDSVISPANTRRRAICSSFVD